MKMCKAIRKRLDYRCQITFWYSALLLTVFLFCFDAHGYQGISQVKFRVFLSLSILYFFAMALVTVDELFTGQLKCCTPLALLRQMGWSQRLVIIYLGLTWLSAMYSPWWPVTVLGASRFEGALSITIYCVSFLLISTYGQPDYRLLAILGISVTLFCLLCLVQMAGFNPFGLYPAGYGYADAGKAYSGAYLGTIGNVDLVSAFLALVFPIMLYALLRLSARVRFLLLIPLILTAIVLVRMSVTAGLVSTVTGCLLAIPVAALRKPKARCRMALIVAGFILASLMAMYLVDFGGELLHQAHMLIRGQAESSFGSGRLYIWAQVLERVPEHPLWGTGPDTMLCAQLTPFTRYDSDLGYIITAQIDAAHNEYLNILFHQGIPALTTYLCVLILLFKAWIHFSPADTSVAIMGSGILSYCIQAFFSISCPLSAPFFWLVLGLLAKRVSKAPTGLYKT